MRYFDRGKHANLSAHNGALIFEFSYQADLIAEFKARIPASARRWQNSDKTWLISAQYGSVCAELVRNFLGLDIEVPNAKRQVGPETKIIELRYLGSTKLHAGEDTPTAFGYVDGEWSVIFPEAVLREWFEGKSGPVTQANTLYGVLGIGREADTAAIKSAYRRLARQWHPDTSSEPDAAAVFIRINEAYQVLSDTAKRRKYDAGLTFSAAQPIPDQIPAWMQQGYRSPLRCGYVLCVGKQDLRFVVSAIQQWEDITRPDGCILVASWPAGATEPVEKWVLV